MRERPFGPRDLFSKESRSTAPGVTGKLYKSYRLISLFPENLKGKKNLR
jgi:hypothetical protein